MLYDGTNLAKKEDVVVVSVNHRLNLFGFLHLADLGGEKWAGATNAGIQDLVAALEWVRDNIEAFGGDPGRVTIFGQSGGGGKTTTVMAMPSRERSVPSRDRAERLGVSRPERRATRLTAPSASREAGFEARAAR